jgi:VanZ family protein
MLCAMRKFWLFVKFWLPPLLWMSVIFCASTSAGSFNHSSRILAPLLRWLYPGIADATVNDLVFAARKMAHLTEYGLFAILLWRAIRQHTAKDTRPWRWREAGWAVLIVACYAATDEFHQTFVPGRGPAVHDVLLDTLGGALGLVVLWAVGRKIKRW